MEILRVGSGFYPRITGPANQAYNLSLRLEKRGISSPIYTSNYGAERSPSFEMMNGIKVRRFPIRGRFLRYMFTPSLVPELLKEEPDIIHAHGYRTFQSDIAYLVSKSKNIPFIVSTHGVALGYEAIVKKEYLKLPYLLYDILTSKVALKGADYVVASTRQEFDELVRFGIEKEKIRIIPVGIDVEEYDVVEVSRDEDEAVNILFVGRINRDRNVDLLLEAFSLIGDRENVKLTIVGGEERRTFTDKLGYMDFLRRRSQELGVSDRVEFTGPLYGQDLIKAYKLADIFVYTSLYENFGQTILEAGAAGLPIISTPVGVANDLIVEGETGFLTSFKDAEELSKKILRLIENERTRRKFSTNVKRLVSEKFRWEDVIEKYLQLYYDLL